MRRRAWLAAAVVLAAAPPTGAGGEPVYGLQGSQAAARLVQVDPVTLEARGRALRLGRFSAERTFSPERSTLAIVSQQRPVVRFIDLARIRAVGDVSLAPAGEVHWLRWTERGLVAVVDPPRGSLLVELDPATRKVTRTLRFNGELAEARLAGGRVVAVEWPAGAVGGIKLHVLEPGGSLRTATVPRIRGGWERRGDEIVRMAEPGLAVAADGARAWLADSDGEICEVDIATLAVACNSFRAPAAATKTSAPWSRRQLRLVAPGTLALTGWEKPKAGPRAAKAIGLWLIDTGSWRRRLLDRSVGSILHARSTIVAIRRGGLDGYDASGARKWRLDEPQQMGVASIAGPFLYVPRQDGRTLVAELDSGRPVATAGAGAARVIADRDTW